MKQPTSPIEIMSPAGSWEAMRAALQSGANSVYFGVEQLHMRSGSTQAFKLEDLPEIAALCASSKAKSYLTLNTVLYDQDLKTMRNICDHAKEARISSVIASDMAAIQYANSIALPVHISTQANVCNLEALKFFAQFSDVVVLARELNLEQIKNICHEIKQQNICGKSGKLLKIEIFVHGALCVAVAGKCYMSLATSNASANRGECRQICRRSYRITDDDTGDELVIDNKYIMSPKDLCTIGVLDQLIDAGVSVLKIEGRGRQPEYVSIVTKVYREAVENIFAETYTLEKISAWTSQLESVYNRGFWQGGYYLGNKLGEWSGAYGSQASQVKTYVGKARKYYPKAQIGEFLIEAGELSFEDEIIVVGPTTGFIREKISSMYVDEKPVVKAEKGSVVTITLSNKIRENDKLYVLQENTKQKRQ